MVENDKVSVEHANDSVGTIIKKEQRQASTTTIN